MVDSPERIWFTEFGECGFIDNGGTEYLRADIAERQIAEARQPQVTDDPATVTYGRLLHRHMKAARRNFAGDDRKRIFTLIEMFRAEFPSECQVWESRYADRGGNDAP
ncbi:MAG: hypothetical protein WA975_18010 [Mesorhizobium sp.]